MYQYHSRPTNDSSKCAGHFCRGNKAPTAKQLYHTSCLSSWGRFFDRACCSTVYLLGRPEATPWCGAILSASKSIYRDNYDGNQCFVQSSCRDQHGPLYSYKIPLEVSGYCHRNADNNKCCSRLGFHVTGDNQ